MPRTKELLHEIEVLNLFTEASMLTGIKIHHDANAETIAAASRLHKKGFITQKDGGYPTNTGIEAIQAAHKLLSLLN